jgi:general nucleoside transport system permease protein
MSAITTEAPQKSRFQFTRRTLFALIFIAIGILFFTNALRHTPETTTVLYFSAQDEAQQGATFTFPTQAFIIISAIYFVIAGAITLFTGGETRKMTEVGTYDGNFGGIIGAWLRRQGNNLPLVIGGIVLIPTLLVIAAAGQDTNMSTLIRSSFQLATPIAIGAMAGIWCERSGVANIAIEGMMLTAACFGFWVLFYVRLVVPPDQYNVALFIGVIVAVLGGGTMALLHAWLSITFRIDQIISGTVINILAVGITSFIRQEYLNSVQQGLDRLPAFSIPILKDIPLIGIIFTNGQPIFYLMFVLIIGSHIVLFYTSWGLRTRAIGEKPSAADTLGIRVNWMRWTNVFIAGLIAGLAGAWFSIENTGTFSEGMTRGSGFIALAAMIFGNWSPFGAFAGALLFGFAESLGTRFQIINVPVPYQFLQMVPYVLTLIVLAGLVGKSYPPKATGIPYTKE